MGNFYRTAIIGPPALDMGPLKLHSSTENQSKPFTATQLKEEKKERETKRQRPPILNPAWGLLAEVFGVKRASPRLVYACIHWPQFLDFWNLLLFLFQD